MGTEALGREEQGRVTVEAERAEAAALASLMEAPPAGVRRALGIRLYRDFDVVGAFVASVDALSLNRVVGLGVGVSATEAALDAALDAARTAGVKRLMVQVPPGASPPALRQWLEARGAALHNRWVRLWRSTATPLAPTPTTPLRVERVGPDHADEFALVARVGFGMPASLDPWLAASVGHPGWEHFAAWDGAQLVATGAMFLAGDVAWFGLAATLDSHRGRGAQSALVTRRFLAARESGARWVVSETAEQRPDHPAPSYRNLLRLGFAEAYLRENLVVTLQG